MSYAQANHAKDQELLAEEPLQQSTPSTLKRQQSCKRCSLVLREAQDIILEESRGGCM